MLEFLKEFLFFLKYRKKWWLIPILLVLAFFGVLIVASQGTSLSPILYTIF